jgi:hypothetical protein
LFPASISKLKWWALTSTGFLHFLCKWLFPSWPPLPFKVDFLSSTPLSQKEVGSIVLVFCFQLWLNIYKKILIFIVYS